MRPNAIEETRAILDSLREQKLLPPNPTQKKGLYENNGLYEKTGQYDKNYDYTSNTSKGKGKVNTEIEQIRKEGEDIAKDAMNLAGKLKEQKKKLKQRKEKWKKTENYLTFQELPENDSPKIYNNDYSYGLNDLTHDTKDYITPISKDEILVQEKQGSPKYPEPYVPRSPSYRSNNDPEAYNQTQQNYNMSFQKKPENHNDFNQKQEYLNNNEELHKNKFMQNNYIREEPVKNKFIQNSLANEDLYKNKFMKNHITDDLPRGSDLTNMSDKIWNGLNEQTAAGTWYNNTDPYENQQRPGKFLQEKISNFAGNNYSMNNSRKKMQDYQEFKRNYFHG